MISLRNTINKTYITIIGIYGILLNAYHLAFKDFAQNNWILAVIVTGFIPLILLYLKTDRIIFFVMVWLAKYYFVDEKWIFGPYNILIAYFENGQERRRSGHVEINFTVDGLSMKGSKLFDTDVTDKVTMESWRSDQVFLFKFAGYYIFLYIYITNEGTKEPNRMGYVTCAFKEEEKGKNMIGYFWDFEGQVTSKRNGTIRITKIDK